MIYKKYFRSFLPSQPQGQLHVKFSLFYFVEQLQFLLASTLIAFDNNCFSFQRLQVRLMLYEIFDSGLWVSNQKSVILFEHLVSNFDESFAFEKLIDFDLIYDMLLFSNKNDQLNEQIDCEDEKYDCRNDNQKQLHL